MPPPDGVPARGRADDVAAAVSDTAAAALAAEMVRIRSYSGDELDIAEFTAARLARAGLDVEMQEVAPRRRNVIGRWRGRGGGPSLMYNGHMDTNPAGAGWTVDPLAGIRDETFVYGIGISNMKASNAAALHAVEVLRGAGVRPRGDLILAYVVGELQGGVGTVKLIESGVRADSFIVGEPTELTLLTRHAASFVFEVWIYGRTRHLSKREEGVDAIMKAQMLLPRLQAMTFSGARSAADRELNRVNVGVIRAGVSQELLDWRPQQLADTCLLRCAGRFGPSQTLEGAMADLEGLLDELRRADPDFRAELKLVRDDRIFMPPFAVEESAAPVRAVAEAHRRVTGTAPKVGAHTPAKFFGSDAAHLARAGMTGLLYGCGGAYNTMPDERVPVAEIGTAARVYVHAFMDLTGAEGP